MEFEVLEGYKNRNKMYEKDYIRLYRDYMFNRNRISDYMLKDYCEKMEMSEKVLEENFDKLEEKYPDIKEYGVKVIMPNVTWKNIHENIIDCFILNNQNIKFVLDNAFKLFGLYNDEVNEYGEHVNQLCFVTSTYPYHSDDDFNYNWFSFITHEEIYRIISMSEDDNCVFGEITHFQDNQLRLIVRNFPEQVFYDDEVYEAIKKYFRDYDGIDVPDLVHYSCFPDSGINFRV